MRKQFMSMALALSLAVTGVSVVPENLSLVYATETTTAEDSPITSIPLFKNAYDFRTYIDNADSDHAYSIQETITDNWNGVGGVHQFTAPQDGTLIYYTFSPEAYVHGKIFSDSSLTNLMKESCMASTREAVAEVSVKKGVTYYFRQERWNGTADITATTYIGLIPSQTSVPCVTPTTNYNKDGNVEVSAVTSVEEFKSMLPNLTGTETIVNQKWTGVSEVHSFSVEKTGWLLVYSYKEDENLNLKIFSDKALSSMILNTQKKTMSEEPDAIWVEPGTYYFYSERWNGADDLDVPQVTYLGFIDAENYLSASAPVLSSDKTTSSITFNTKTAGSIRIMPGLPEPSIINSDDFWQINTRVNMLQNTNTYTATANGSYVARFQDNASKMYYMIPFTISGIETKQPETPKVKVKKPSAKPVIKSAVNVKGKKIKITLKKKVSGATGYQISYAANSKFKKAVTKKFKKTSITLTKLKKKKTYYIRVCAYNSAGSGKWSAVKKVKIKK